MPWEPITGAPATFNLASAALAAIEADNTLQWIVPYLPFVPDTVFETAPFCEHGPLPDPQFGLGDFSPHMDGGDQIGQQALAYLAQRIQQLFYNRAFGNYCHNTDAVAGEHEQLLVGTDSVTGQWTSWLLPDGATGMYVTIAGGGGVFRSLWTPYIYEGGPSDALQIASGPTDASNAITYTPVAGRPWLSVQYANPARTATALGVPNGASGDTPYVPTPQPEPDGFIGPTPGVYTSFAQLGAELDALELKLDAVLSYLSAANVLLPIAGPTEIADAVEAAGDTPVDLAHSAGVLLALTHLSPAADMTFGPPATYRELGRVIFGNHGALGPIVLIVSDPQVILPLPPGSDTMYVQYDLPNTGAYRLIPKT